MSDTDYAKSSIIGKTLEAAIKKTEDLLKKEHRHAIQILEARHEIALMHTVHDNQEREIHLLNLAIKKLEDILIEERKARIAIAESWGHGVPF